MNGTQNNSAFDIFAGIQNAITGIGSIVQNVQNTTAAVNQNAHRPVPTMNWAAQQSGRALTDTVMAYAPLFIIGLIAWKLIK